MDKDKLLTVKQVSARLACDPCHVRDMIDVGEMVAVDVGLGRRMWRVHESEFQKYLKENTN